jgi:hypothetical protein
LAVGPRLRAYLALERALVDLDDAGDPVGDELRGRMDPIWLKLSEEDRDALDGRIGDPSLFAGTLGPQTLTQADDPVVATPRRDLAVRWSVRAHFRRAA